MDKIKKKWKLQTYLEFRKSIAKKQATILVFGCLILFLISTYYLMRCFVFHNIDYVTDEHIAMIYIPMTILTSLYVIIYLFMRKKAQKRWRILEVITYMTICVMPYWGLGIMIVSVIEGRNTNFLVWVIGMLISSSGLCILPYVTLTNQLLVTLFSFMCSNIHHIEFGESHTINIIVYGFVCIWISFLRFHDQYKEFKTNRELQSAIEEANKNKEEADKANNAKSTFLAHMSHELRTPINAIMGMNELIVRKNIDPEIGDYALNIKNSGDMLLSLVNDILDFSKIEAGRMEIVKQGYHLTHILSDLIGMIDFKLKEKGLTFDVVVNEQTPDDLCGDEIRIKQIISNLLTNAIKYTREGSVTCKVDYKRIDNENIELIIAVKDTGIGIKEDDKKKLCKSFQRLDETRNKSIEGTGLGLCIAMELLELMNGSMEIDSQYGIGSCFTVHIPQEVDGDTCIGKFDEKYRQCEQEKKSYKCLFHAPHAKILVVDDNATNRILTKALLQENHIQVELADSGKQALEYLKDNHYDIVLLDHRMPNMDGVETLHAMRDNHFGEGIPVIALTANVVPGVHEYFLTEGFEDFLSKPVHPGKLEQVVYQYLPKEKIIDVVGEFCEMPVGKQNKNNNKTVTIDKQDVIHHVEKEGYIDFQAGLEWCAYDEKTYHDVLKSYYDASESKKELLHDSLLEKDLKRFTIEIHGIKSASRTIGAEPIAQIAERMEKMGNLYKQVELTAIMPEFLNEYEALLRNIGNKLSENEEL